MLTRDFFYDLPPGLIAQRPAEARSASRLLCVDGGTAALDDRQFSELPGLLRANDLLVMNDTRVIPARLHGRKDSGGRVELLIERVLDERHALAQVRASKRPHPGRKLLLDRDIAASVVERRGEFWLLCFTAPVLETLDRIGHVPLPPYLGRGDEAQDRERYQTIYGTRPGAVAAPTAGLHFDGELLERLADAGIGRAYVTLHVGAGTFQPVRTRRVEEHRMHAETVSVPKSTVELVRRTRANGGRVVAVGTTVVRSLETASRSGELQPFEGESRLFIYPGFRFRSVDALITNFHLPESSLLMMVSAFAGYGAVMEAYRHAIALEYRFYSFGDAMLVSRNTTPDFPPSGGHKGPFPVHRRSSIDPG